MLQETVMVGWLAGRVDWDRMYVIKNFCVYKAD